MLAGNHWLAASFSSQSKRTIPSGMVHEEATIMQVLAPHNARSIETRLAKRSLKRRFASAFTLVELLVSMALTLIIVYAIAEFYARVGTSVRNGRALIELRGQLRNVSQKLQSDLNSMTVKGVPGVDEAAGLGYLEIHEGYRRDWDCDANGTADYQQAITDNWPSSSITDLLGDADDIISGTIQSSSAIYLGRVPASVSGNGVAQSRQAEFIWFVSFTDLDGDAEWDLNEPRELHRRQLVVMPELNSNPGVVGGPFTAPFAAADVRNTLASWYQNYDVSVRVESQSGGQFVLRANSLGDLSVRANRFAHQVTAGFPNRLDLVGAGGAADSLLGFMHPDFVIGRSIAVTPNTGASGEDLMMNNLLAFDVRLFDPTAPIYAHPTVGNEAVTPTDPDYPPATGTPIGRGAFVDLGHNRAASTFSGAPAAESGLGTETTYDTWTTLYERDGVDNRSLGHLDLGVNGIDDNNDGRVDEPAERDTLPPYGAPITGVQVRIRCQDITSRQVQQATVSADFIAD